VYITSIAEPGMKEKGKRQKYRPFRPYFSAIPEDLFRFCAIQ
jgi:hypothetical protein